MTLLPLTRAGGKSPTLTARGPSPHARSLYRCPTRAAIRCPQPSAETEDTPALQSSSPRAGCSTFHFPRGRPATQRSPDELDPAKATVDPGSPEQARPNCAPSRSAGHSLISTGRGGSISLTPPTAAT
jgi:hypothetical protein